MRLRCRQESVVVKPYCWSWQRRQMLLLQAPQRRWMALRHLLQSHSSVSRSPYPVV